MQDDEAGVWERYLGSVHLGVEVDGRPVREGLFDVALWERVNYVAVLEDLSSSAIVKFPLDRTVFIDDLDLIFLDYLFVYVKLAS